MRCSIWQASQSTTTRTNCVATCTQPLPNAFRIPTPLVTFATPQARDAYLNDPNHRPVAEAIGAAAEQIVVFDV
jgi:Stress responsive A/B Barrel Domain